MATRARALRKTAERDYGGRHQKLQAAALAQWRPGDPCTRCGQPMWQRWAYTRSGRRVSAIHLGHTDDRTGYTGLEHAHCNLSDGATRGNRQRGQRRAAMKAGRPTAPLRTSRRW